MNPTNVTATRKPKNGLRLAVIHTACAIVAASAVVLGAFQVADGQQIDSQDGDKGTVAGVLSVMNAARTARGLGRVSGNEVLHRAAQWMAEELAARDTLDHTDSRHRGVASRLQAFGYENFRLIAENIAEGQETPTAVVNSWMHSPPHRANLLHPGVRQAGIGHAINAQGHHYWVLDLGTAFTKS